MSDRREPGSPARRETQHVLGAALLVIYLLAALLGAFHGWEKPEVSHVCGGGTVELVDAHDGAPEHDEDHCALCHLAVSPRVLETPDTTVVFESTDGRGVVWPTVAERPTTATPANRPRAPPSV